MIVIRKMSSWIVLLISVPFSLTLMHTTYFSSMRPPIRITGIQRPHNPESANVTTLPIMSDQVIRPSVEARISSKVHRKETRNKSPSSRLKKYPNYQDKDLKSHQITNTEKIPASSEYKESILESPPAPINQKQYFLDIVMSINRPYFYEFGHIFEKLHSGWEERFERMNLKDHRYQGKVKWGSRDSEHGQHYYDLNHHNNS